MTLKRQKHRGLSALAVVLVVGSFVSGCTQPTPDTHWEPPGSFSPEEQERRKYLSLHPSQVAPLIALPDIAYATFYGGDAFLDRHGNELKIWDRAVLADLHQLLMTPAPMRGPNFQDLSAKTSVLELRDKSDRPLLNVNFTQGGWTIDLPRPFEDLMRRVSKAEAHALAAEVREMEHRNGIRKAVLPMSNFPKYDDYTLIEIDPQTRTALLSLLKSGDPHLYSYTAYGMHTIMVRLVGRSQNKEVHIVLPTRREHSLDALPFRDAKSRQAVRLLQRYVDLDDKRRFTANLDSGVFLPQP